MPEVTSRYAFCKPDADLKSFIPEQLLDAPCGWIGYGGYKLKKCLLNVKSEDFASSGAVNC